MATSNHYNSPLDRVPREIRNNIYGHLVATYRSVVQHTLKTDRDACVRRTTETKRVPLLAAAAKRFYDELVHNIIPQHQHLCVPLSFRFMDPEVHEDSPYFSDFAPNRHAALHLSISIEARDTNRALPWHTNGEFLGPCIRENGCWYQFPLPCDVFDLPGLFPNLRSMSFNILQHPPRFWDVSADTVEVWLQTAMIGLPNIKEYWFGTYGEQYGTLFVKNGEKIDCFSTLWVGHADLDFDDERTTGFLVGNSREIVAEKPSFSIRLQALGAGEKESDI